LYYLFSFDNVLEYIYLTKINYNKFTKVGYKKTKIVLVVVKRKRGGENNNASLYSP